jgi:hypothetical protein
MRKWMQRFFRGAVHMAIPAEVGRLGRLGNGESETATARSDAGWLVLCLASQLQGQAGESRLQSARL